jgi:phospholipid-binding lipoprotein MlaA
MFWFNDKLYFYLLKPVARAYRVVPEPARESVSRAFSNLGTPVRFVNATLQLKFREAGTELGRFVLNSTIGIFGLFDPAQTMGLKKHEEDFGQTLGHYGAGPGFYLVIPILGPSNLRDGVGRVADILVDPITSPYYLELKQLEEIGLRSYDQVNNLSLDKDTYEGIKRDALDPYLFVRNAYMQHRAAKVEE